MSLSYDGAIWLPNVHTPIGKYSKLRILKFGIQTGLGLDNLCQPFLLSK